MLEHSELTKGTYFLFEGTPHVVLEAAPFFRGRGSSVQQVKIKNVKTGAVLQKSFHAGDSFEEAEVSKVEVRFVYARKQTYVFSYAGNPGRRFELPEERLGAQARFLKEGEALEGIVFKDEVINVSLPVKVQLKVVQAPPGVQGDRSQSGTKTVVLETGAEIAAPLFVEEGDTLEVNTQTGEYVRRVQD